MPPISNSDMMYLYTAKIIEDNFKAGRTAEAFRDCRTSLQDAHLPFYYRGHYNIMLSKDVEDDPIGYAVKGLQAFDRMMEQSPGDADVAIYVLYAQQVLSDVEKAAETRAQVEEESRVSEAQKCESDGADDPSLSEITTLLREFKRNYEATHPEKDVQEAPVTSASDPTPPDVQKSVPAPINLQSSKHENSTSAATSMTSTPTPIDGNAPIIQK